MEQRPIMIGKKYKHFKGTYHKIIALAKHSETLEQMVVYTHEGTNEIWTRPYESFIGKVDYKKYPDSKQEYRFELVEDND